MIEPCANSLALSDARHWLAALALGALLVAVTAGNVGGQEDVRPPRPDAATTLPPPVPPPAAGETDSGVELLPPVAGSILSLQDVAWLAMTYNPTLRQARANVDEARGLAIQAGLYPNPRFDTGNPQQLGGSNTLFDGGLTQEWVRGGKLRLDVSAAEQAVRQAQLAYTRQQFDLLTDVRQQFFAVLADQERVVMFSNLVAIAQKSVEIAQNKLTNGQGTETDMLLLRIDLRRVQANLQQTETILRAGRQQLAALIGLPQLPIERLVGDLHVALPDYQDEIVRAQTLARNAQVQIARADIARNQLLLRRAEVEPTPNIFWTGGYQYTVSPTHNQALVNAVFVIPLWNKNQGNIRTANGNVAESVAMLNVTQNDLLKLAADALARYRSARRMVLAFEQSILPDARRTQSLVQQGYDQGELELVRLLEAQRALFQANLDYIDAEQARLQAAADLANLMQLEQFP
ncbi:MAG TPA: TolC family protein [Pirellulales bacterium]|nr:TolC family protein [Pirellulales bacterium]